MLLVWEERLRPSLQDFAQGSDNSLVRVQLPLAFG